MKLIYYTSTSYLDCAIEIINVLKEHVELHVLIEISPETKIATIINIQDLPEGEVLVPVNKLIDNHTYKHLEPYFKGTASTNFVVFTHKRSISWATLHTCREAGKFIKSINPSVAHFDSISHRAIALIPFIRNMSIYITIHDPVPHSGESNWRLKLARLLYFPLAKGYFFYSQFAKKQFEEKFKKIKSPKHVLRMFPYSFYQRFLKDGIEVKKHILFFGRVSQYKGVDILIKASEHLFKEYPDETLIIAGRHHDSFKSDLKEIGNLNNQVIFLNEYVPTDKLSHLINGAKLVVCPYKDATQSGVLMTAFAIGTPIVATDVGSFPEYIENYIDGILIPPNDSVALTLSLQSAIKDDNYKVMGNNLKKKYSNGYSWSSNSIILMEAYNSR